MVEEIGPVFFGLEADGVRGKLEVAMSAVSSAVGGSDVDVVVWMVDSLLCGGHRSGGGGGGGWRSGM